MHSNNTVLTECHKAINLLQSRIPLALCASDRPIKLLAEKRFSSRLQPNFFFASTKPNFNLSKLHQLRWLSLTFSSFCKPWILLTRQSNHQPGQDNRLRSNRKTNKDSQPSAKSFFLGWTLKSSFPERNGDCKPLISLLVIWSVSVQHRGLEAIFGVSTAEEPSITVRVVMWFECSRPRWVMVEPSLVLSSGIDAIVKLSSKSPPYSFTLLVIRIVALTGWWWVCGTLIFLGLTVDLEVRKTQLVEYEIQKKLTTRFFI